MTNFHENLGEVLRKAASEFRAHQHRETANAYAIAVLNAHKGGILDDYDCGSKLGEAADWLIQTSEAFDRRA